MFNKILFPIFIAFGLQLSAQKIWFDADDSLSKVNYYYGLPINSKKTDSYYIFKNQYALSYNPQKSTANWVAWNLNNGWIGETDRYKGQFITDTIIPKKHYRAKHKDYTNSGFDRGHIVRSKERSNNEINNRSTFLMSNIFPQTPDLNRGLWLNFEYYCEKLCTQEDKNLFIYAGGVFVSDSTLHGKGKIAIPDSCFKIVIITDFNNKLPQINKNTEIIAVMMPNKEGIRREKWQNYTTTIRNIEVQTSYNFFSNLPQELQDSIENKKWNSKP
ncbi:MAG: DNA/RNA non-specific endonuclease [Bacteroidales bacterium]|nr:DNA/RNA non-specific endonuclease [Bacteroidales bacterium]